MFLASEELRAEKRSLSKQSQQSQLSSARGHNDSVSASVVDVTASAVDGVVPNAALGAEGEHAQSIPAESSQSIMFEGEHRRAENEHRLETAPMASPNTAENKPLTVNQRLSMANHSSSSSSSSQARVSTERVSIRDGNYFLFAGNPNSAENRAL